jgi:hypothetical protein
VLRGLLAKVVEDGDDARGVRLEDLHGARLDYRAFQLDGLCQRLARSQGGKRRDLGALLEPLCGRTDLARLEALRINEHSQVVCPPQKRAQSLTVAPLLRRDRTPEISRLGQPDGESGIEIAHRVFIGSQRLDDLAGIVLLLPAVRHGSLPCLVPAL